MAVHRTTGVTGAGAAASLVKGFAEVSVGMSSTSPRVDPGNNESEPTTQQDSDQSDHGPVLSFNGCRFTARHRHHVIRYGRSGNIIGVSLVHLVPTLPYMTLVMSGVCANYDVD